MFETELVLSAISGAKLMDLEFMPQEFVVRGLLPKGLSILGGAPKIGKSWLMLELALRVANGDPMWGMETKQGTVLYYCLEDTLQRIQQRLYCITENGPDNLLFETATGTLATNLEEEILLYIKRHPDMSLIIIDISSFYMYHLYQKVTYIQEKIPLTAGILGKFQFGKASLNSR